MYQYYKISKSVELNFTNDNPMQCKYTFDENKDNYIRFYLVPVIDDWILFVHVLPNHKKTLSIRGLPVYA